MAYWPAVPLRYRTYPGAQLDWFHDPTTTIDYGTLFVEPSDLCCCLVVPWLLYLVIGVSTLLWLWLQVNLLLDLIDALVITGTLYLVDYSPTVDALEDLTDTYQEHCWVLIAGWALLPVITWCHYPITLRTLPLLLRLTIGGIPMITTGHWVLVVVSDLLIAGTVLPLRYIVEPVILPLRLLRTLLLLGCYYIARLLLPLIVIGITLLPIALFLLNHVIDR